MRGPIASRIRFTALGLAATLIAPHLGAPLLHVVDHDGATHHIETAHGGHLPIVSEGDSRLASGGLKLSPAVVSARAPELPGAPSVSWAPSGCDDRRPATRAPPGALRSRAPPA